MTWFAVDDRFPTHPKVFALEEFAVHDSALALWLKAGSWACSQTSQAMTGLIPRHMLTKFGVNDPDECAAALVDVGLWDVVDAGWRFHDWDEWNGPGARQNRSKAVSRRSSHKHRIVKCERGEHSDECPTTDLDGNDRTCPARAGKQSDTVADEVSGEPPLQRPVPSRPVPARPEVTSLAVTLTNGPASDPVTPRDVTGSHGDHLVCPVCETSVGSDIAALFDGAHPGCLPAAS